MTAHTRIRIRIRQRSGTRRGLGNAGKNITENHGIIILYPHMEVSRFFRHFFFRRFQGPFLSRNVDVEYACPNTSGTWPRTGLERILTCFVLADECRRSSVEYAARGATTALATPSSPTAHGADENVTLEHPDDSLDSDASGYADME